MILESLNVLLGYEEIGDDHLLLSRGGELWHALGSAENWYEVGQKAGRQRHG